MAFRRPKDEELSTQKWLEMDANMTGTIAFKDPVNLQINGQFQGELDAKGHLSIGEKAEVRANLRGEAIAIGGSVIGNVTAASLVELLATARVSGKITSPKLIVHEGAVLQGNVDMNGATSDPRWMTIEELARYLEVEAATVSQWAQSGRLPGQQERGEWRFERAKIEEWLAHERIK